MKFLEYHKFGSEPEDYQWYRTFEQFEKDLDCASECKFRFDDGHKGQYVACLMAEKRNIKVYLGITTSFVGTEGYLTWENIRALSLKHIICNHSMLHEHLDDKTEDEIYEELKEANRIIEAKTWKKVTHYCPTYNFINDNVRNACKRLGLEIVDPVVAVSRTTYLYAR